MTHGGDYTNRGGCKHSTESKEKIRNSLLDIKHTKERRKKNYQSIKRYLRRSPMAALRRFILQQLQKIILN